MKSNKKPIIITIIILTACALTLTGIYSANNIKFKKLQLSYTCSTANVQSETSIKTNPSFLGIPKGNVSENATVKIVAKGKKWSKIVYFDEKGIKNGYIKNSSLANESESTVLIDALRFEKRKITITAGEEYELKPAITPYYSNEQITYTPSDDNIATVENGILKGVNAGETEIQVSTTNKKDTLKITVLENPETFEAATDILYMDKGSYENLIYHINCDSDKKNSVNFTSSDSSVVNLSGTKARAISEGDCVITATCGAKSAKIKIVVRNLSQNADKPLCMKNAYGNIYNFHPSIQPFDEEWNGYRYWCAFTPYEGNNDYYENPHILASNDLVNWEEPKGFTNPLEPVPEKYEASQCYNSDTELVYNSDTGELECWWRFYDRPNGEVSLYRKTTKDGVHWSDKQQTMLSKNMKKHDFLSPALVYENHTYKMWAIDLNGHKVNYYESKDAFNWSDPKIINVEYENPNIRSWHFDVIHTPKGYEMLLSAFSKTNDDHMHMSLYYAFSTDNENYTKARLLLTPYKDGDHWDDKGLYRSSLFYTNNKYYCVYTGINEKTGPTGLGIISGNNPFHMS